MFAGTVKGKVFALVFVRGKIRPLEEYTKFGPGISTASFKFCALNKFLSFKSPQKLSSVLRSSHSLVTRENSRASAV